MNRVGIVLHGTREDALLAGRRLIELLTGRGVSVEAARADAERLGGAIVAAGERFPAGLDLLFALGGDGTLLRAARRAAGTGTPLLGVNLGRLGFLSELEGGELESGLARVLDAGFEIEERLTLEGEVVEGGRSTPLWALNDVIIEKVDIGRAIKLSVQIAGEPFIAWAADGLIVSTSTGSTAYSFSAGGPVVSPRIECLLITPVSPHGLYDRTTIVPPDEEVVVALLPDPDAASLSADGGPALRLSSGAEVRLRAGKDRLRLAKLEPAPFWRLVRRKLGLPPDR